MKLKEKLKEKPKGLAKYYGIIIIQWFTLQPFASFFSNFKLCKNAERPSAHSGYMF